MTRVGTLSGRRIVVTRAREQAADLVRALEDRGAEAIVAPQQLVQYLGAHERFHPECDLAYNNQLMVLLWSTLATRDTRLARVALGRMRSAPRL